LKGPGGKECWYLFSFQPDKAFGNSLDGKEKRKGNNHVCRREGPAHGGLGQRHMRSYQPPPISPRSALAAQAERPAGCAGASVPAGSTNPHGGSAFKQGRRIRPDPEDEGRGDGNLLGRTIHAVGLNTDCRDCCSPTSSTWVQRDRTGRLTQARACPGMAGMYSGMNHRAVAIYGRMWHYLRPVSDGRRLPPPPNQKEALPVVVRGEKWKRSRPMTKPLRARRSGPMETPRHPGIICCRSQGHGGEEESQGAVGITARSVSTRRHPPVEATSRATRVNCRLIKA